jgi:hypothetical protein
LNRHDYYYFSPRQGLFIENVAMVTLPFLLPCQFPSHLVLYELLARDDCALSRLCNSVTALIFFQVVQQRALSRTIAH